jgi:hypothetical protein
MMYKCPYAQQEDCPYESLSQDDMDCHVSIAHRDAPITFPGNQILSFKNLKGKSA